MAKERTKGVGRDMVAEPMQDFWVYRLAPLARTSTQLRRTATLPGAPPFKATAHFLRLLTRLFGSCASVSSSSGMDVSPTSQLPGPHSHSDEFARVTALLGFGGQCEVRGDPGGLRCTLGGARPLAPNLGSRARLPWHLLASPAFWAQFEANGMWSKRFLAGSSEPSLGLRVASSCQQKPFSPLSVPP